jgi:hypothetical protein
MNRRTYYNEDVDLENSTDGSNNIIRAATKCSNRRPKASQRLNTQ